MSEEEDFEEQLQQEKKAKVEEEEKETVHQGLTYTDTDGTVMEWDHARRAYFPQIDNDFIARYQMNYGSFASETENDPSTTSTTTTTATTDNYQAWYDYYNQYNQQATTDAATNSTGDSAQENVEGSSQSNYTTKDYYNYYRYYYGEEYAQKWLNTKMEEEEEEEELRKEEEAKKKAEEGGKEKEDGAEKEDGGGGGKGKSKKKDKDRQTAKRPAPEQQAAWFDMDTENSTQVYVSGLPSDITNEEFEKLMSKCGLIMLDPYTRKNKVKLYCNPDGSLKGDGLCCYIKRESVDLALGILDGSNVHGNIISVEQAQFEMKGDFDPSKKKKKLSNKAKRKFKENQKKLFDWRPDKPRDVRMKFERIVILKNMFECREFEEDPSLINELRDDVRSECVKFGDVRKVQVHDRHPDGVISVTMRSPEEADACVAALKGRWFAKKQIIAETYDGKTKYDVNETDAERDERLRGWEAFISGNSDGMKKTTEGGGDSEGNEGKSYRDAARKDGGGSRADDASLAGPSSGSGASGASCEGVENVGMNVGDTGGGVQSSSSEDSCGGAAN